MARKCWVAIWTHEKNDQGKTSDWFPFEQEPSEEFVRQHINKCQRAAGKPIIQKTDTIEIRRGRIGKAEY